MLFSTLFEHGEEKVSTIRVLVFRLLQHSDKLVEELRFGML